MENVLYFKIETEKGDDSGKNRATHYIPMNNSGSVMYFVHFDTQVPVLDDLGQDTGEKKTEERLAIVFGIIAENVIKVPLKAVRKIKQNKQEIAYLHEDAKIVKLPVEVVINDPEEIKVKLEYLNKYSI